MSARRCCLLVPLPLPPCRRCLPPPSLPSPAPPPTNPPSPHRSPASCARYARHLGAFINLESTGPWGPDVVFQHTGDWTLKVGDRGAPAGVPHEVLRLAAAVGSAWGSICLVRRGTAAATKQASARSHIHLCLATHHSSKLPHPSHHHPCMQAYARSAPHPRGTTMAQDFFDLGGSAGL